MKKLFRSKKALSPVVAAIILIAVTVAVSIAVAAWMGALSFGFMGTEQLTFTGYEWASPGDTTVPWITITVKNTGSADLSIAEIRVDGTTSGVTVDKSLPYSLPKGQSVTFNITITGGFTRGTAYEFTVLTSKGNLFGPYIKTAP